MTEQPTALRLADALRDGVSYDEAEIENELRRLHAENAELREANEAFGKRQEWWNERMFVLEQQRDALLEALKGITPPMPPADAPCHVGLVPQEKCAHCGRIARARAAIKAVEGMK